LEEGIYQNASAIASGNFTFFSSSLLVEKRTMGFTAKTAKKSSNASPASPVNTRTAERAFELEMSLC